MKKALYTTEISHSCDKYGYEQGNIEHYEFPSLEMCFITKTAKQMKMHELYELPTIK